MKFLAFMLAAVVLGVCMASCSKDENVDAVGSKLFGTWVRNIDETEDGVRYILTETYQFRNNGTGENVQEMTIKESGVTTTIDPQRKAFKYTYSEKEELLLITFEGATQAAGYGVQLTGNTLMLTQSSNGTTLISTYIRK